MSRPRSLDWRSLPADPDLEADMGYELADWNVIQAEAADSLMFLPADEEMLRDEAFIVADSRSVTDVSTRR